MVQTCVKVTMLVVLLVCTVNVQAAIEFTEDWSAYGDYDFVAASGKGNWQMLTPGYDIRLRSWPYGMRTTYGLEGHYGSNPGYVNEIIHPVVASDEDSASYTLSFQSFTGYNRPNLGANAYHTKHTGMGLYDTSSGEVLAELYYDYQESGWMLDGTGLGGTVDAVTGSIIDGENEFVNATLVVDLENGEFWAEYTSPHFPNRVSAVQTITATDFTIDAVYLVESLGWSSQWAQSCRGGAIHDIELDVTQIPEPATLALVAGGMMALIRRRR